MARLRSLLLLLSGLTFIISRSQNQPDEATTTTTSTTLRCFQPDYLTTKDMTVAKDARDKVFDYCTGGLEGIKGEVDREAGHDQLVDAVGGDNRVFDVLKEAKSPEELSKLYEEQLEDVNLIITKGGGIIMSIILLVTYSICCWSWWSACRCCRCCAKERYTHNRTKVLAMVAILVGVVGVLFGAALSVRGATRMLDGFDNLACTSATLLSRSLNGSVGQKWEGLLPMLETFEKLDNKMETGSVFMDETDIKLGNTYEIDAATEEASETLSKTEQSLQESSVSLSLFETPFHCVLCEIWASHISRVQGTLKGGLAEALRDARKEVREQLDTEVRHSLQCDIRSATEPLKDVKDTIRDSLEWFIADDGFAEIHRFIGRSDSPLVVIVVALAAVLCVLLINCACCGMCCFICKERFNRPESRNPYNRWPVWASSCTWCCGFCYSILVFLTGGILVAASYNLSGLCLVMEDFDSTIFNQIYPALGIKTLQPNTDRWDVVMNVTDQCLSTKSNRTGNLMDMIFVREDPENANSRKVYMRELLVENVVKKLDEKFDRLAEISVDQTLADQSEVANLISRLDTYPISSFIMTIDSEMRNDARYKDFELDTRGTDGVQRAFESSLNCKDFDVPAGSFILDSFFLLGQQLIQVRAQPATIYGIESVSATFSKYGSTSVQNGTCVPDFTCKQDADDSEDKVCKAIQYYIDRVKLLTSPSGANFRCDLFAEPYSQVVIETNLSRAAVMGESTIEVANITGVESGMEVELKEGANTVRKTVGAIVRSSSIVHLNSDLGRSWSERDTRVSFRQACDPVDLYRNPLGTWKNSCVRTTCEATHVDGSFYLPHNLPMHHTCNADTTDSTDFPTTIWNFNGTRQYPFTFENASQRCRAECDRRENCVFYAMAEDEKREGCVNDKPAGCPTPSGNLTYLRCYFFNSCSETGRICSEARLDRECPAPAKWMRWSTFAKQPGTLCNSELTTMPLACNLDDFTAYVKDSAKRINETLKRVDQVVDEVGPQIQVELDKWIEEEFVNPMKVVVDGAACNFLNVAYDGMVQGLCYQGAWGLRAVGNAYVTIASMTLILIVLSYAIWRRTLDNRRLWRKPQAHHPDQSMKQHPQTQEGLTGVQPPEVVQPAET